MCETLNPRTNMIVVAPGEPGNDHKTYRAYPTHHRNVSSSWYTKHSTASRALCLVCATTFSPGLDTQSIQKIVFYCSVERYDTIPVALNTRQLSTSLCPGKMRTWYLLNELFQVHGYLLRTPLVCATLHQVLVSPENRPRRVDLCAAVPT